MNFECEIFEINDVKKKNVNIKSSCVGWLHYKKCGYNYGPDIMFEEKKEKNLCGSVNTSDILEKYGKFQKRIL